MRQRQVKIRNAKRETTKREPMAEGVIPLKNNGDRKWFKMGDVQLVEYAKKFMKEKGITGRMELIKADSGLYQALKRRNILGKIGFEQKRREKRRWSRIGDAQLIQYANKFCNENGITRRDELKKADNGLYEILRIRKLQTSIFPNIARIKRQAREQADDKPSMKKNEKKKRFSPDEKDYLIRRRQELIAQGQTERRISAKLADETGRTIGTIGVWVYRLVRDKKLPKNPNRLGSRSSGFFTSMSDEELVSYALHLMKEKGLTNITDLIKNDLGLRGVFYERKLLSKYFGHVRRNWASMSDDEIVYHTEKFMKEKEIRTRGELMKKDPSLYGALSRRKLLGKFNPEKPIRTLKFRKYRPEEVDYIIERWQGLAREGKLDHEILRTISAELNENPNSISGLVGRLKKGKQLSENPNKGRKPFIDYELEKISQTRDKLIPRGLTDKEIARTLCKELGRSVGTISGKISKLVKEGRLATNPNKKPRRPNGFLAAMKDEDLLSIALALIKEKGILRKKEMEHADSRLYSELVERKLIARLGLEEGKRKWKAMSDEEVVQFTIDFVRAKGINKKSELCDADPGLYDVLLKRKLIARIDFNVIFSRSPRIMAQRRWSSMSHEEILTHARNLMRDNGIRKKSELNDYDCGLYQALSKRNLLDEIEFVPGKKKGRDWASMSDEELVGFAKEYLKEKRICERMELIDADHPLYEVLRRRGLLELAFSDLENTKRKSVDHQLLSGLLRAPEAMEKFGEGK